jgi:hypothetical protein
MQKPKTKALNRESYSCWYNLRENPSQFKIYRLGRICRKVVLPEGPPHLALVSSMMAKIITI